MKDYDAYLFDMDGTVTQTFDAWMRIVKATLKRYDIVADDKTLIRKIFGNAENGLVELGVPKEDLSEIFSEWDSKAAVSMTRIKLYPHIEAVLAALKQKGKKLALITATARSTTDVILASHGLNDIFDVTICGNEMAAHKPDPGSILTAIDKLQTEKQKVIMLGDSEKDIRAAHNAGIDSVLFFRPNITRFIRSMNWRSKIRPIQFVHGVSWSISYHSSMNTLHVRTAQSKVEPRFSRELRPGACQII
ncbi:MAG TPA: HAD family hydrolase [Candidatus Saccharimonadales bacterium]|nr:HAD family hydrolase [Candidatus Saccharimonadales bacterium]